MGKSMTKKLWFACWVVLVYLGGDMAAAQDKNAMLVVVKAGDVNNVQALLDANPVLVQVQDRYQWTPLHHAVALGSQDIIALLLAGGADTNAKNRSGSTSLHVAVSAGNLETVELLLARGAEVGASNRVVP